MPEQPVCFDLETLSRARRALDDETNPDVIRAWALLFDKGYIGERPHALAPALRYAGLSGYPGCDADPDPGRDYGLKQLAVLLGAQARA